VTVNGVKNVISSFNKVIAAGQLKNIVMTSSIAAIQDLQRPQNHVYTEADYNESATVVEDAYSTSKYQSECVMRDWARAQNDSGFDIKVAFINPGAIFGPIFAQQHTLGSSTMIHEMMMGKVPAAPHLDFPSVDVRDVALAQITAMEKNATGRFVCIEKNLSMIEIARSGKESFPQYKFPTWQLPNCFMYMAAVFDKRITFSFLRNNFDKHRSFSNRRMVDELGVTPSLLAGSCIADSCQSFIDIGVVPKK
jgi:dihydroflavonol-4-reductase